MRRRGASLSAGSASRESREDAFGVNVTTQQNNYNQQFNLSFGNTHSGTSTASETGIAGNRLARRQARCAGDRRRRAFEEMRRRVEGFDKTAKATLQKARPTNEELRRFVDQEFRPTTKASMQVRLQERALELSAAELRQVEIMKSLDRESANKGHGWVPLKKPDGTTRLILENWNSIKYWSEAKSQVDINVIEATRKRYDADVLAGVEHQVNFSKAPEDRQFHDTFGFGEERKSVESHNRHNAEHRSAYGGTGLMVFGRLSNYVKKAGDRDPTGLGRWCSLVVKSGEKLVRFVVVYRPNKESSSRRHRRGNGAGSVWRQQSRYFRSIGRDDGDPLQFFDRDLCAALRSWRAAGEEIILAGDLNSNVYTSSIAKDLAHRDIGLVEQFQALYDEPAPASHFSGSEPIMGVFATAGIQVTAAFLSKHKVKGTVGDHRLHVFDFSTVSITGIDEPTIERAEGRNLQCRNYAAKVNYAKVLMQLTARHRMWTKSAFLKHQRTILTPAEFQIQANKYDKEIVELMLAAEKRCRTKKMDYLEWSPIVGTYLRHLHIYRWIIRFKHGRKTNQSNLKRTCDANSIPSPVQMTLAEAELGELTCLRKLDEIRANAPQFRVAHLQDCIDKARTAGKLDKVDALIRLMRRERERKKNRRLHVSFGKKKGNPPSRIAVPCETGPDPIFSKRDQVEQVAADHLTERYMSAHSSPFASGRLLDDVGHTGDGPAVKDILRGTYDFPPDYDDASKQLCIEASRIFSKTAEDMIQTFIERETFQDWWLTANEDIQSSKSGCHFSHYKAAAENDYLSALHVARLNLALETGIPYERWTHGVTVLLEKEFGSIYIHKLRAICLFEADFNWLQKIIFAQRMIRNARGKKIIPPEQCATAGVDSNQGSMLKVFHCDSYRTMHVPYSVISADLANCYDAVNHAVAALALLAFGVPYLAVKLVLTCLQSMYFWLRTAFGISGTPFHGTAVNPFFGISQGGGFAPPTFQAVSALMINSYKSFGHGVQYVSPVTGLIIFFAAILYVDDTDLLLRADSPTTPDADFFAKIQHAVTDWARVVIATGGSLKPPKCHASVASFRFIGGVAKMKSKRALPSVTLTVPQKDGPPKKIAVIEPTESKKTLGVFTNLTGDGTDHLKYIRGKGLEWASKLQTNRYVQASDGWQSLHTQLKPKMTWGIVCLSSPPAKVDKALASVYHRSLGRLGVHRSIRRELRTLPEMYQGLGMFDLNVERLGAKVFFLRRHWGTQEVMGQMLRHAFEVFQVDVGLHGNIFTRDFKRLSHLAARSWFYDVWRLCDHFDVSLVVHRSNDIPLIRVGDRALMECFLDLRVFSSDQLDVLARFRKFFAVHSLAEILCCDGCTVRQDVLSYRRGRSARQYPFEKPLRRDLELWIGALKLVTSPRLVLERPLGEFLLMPPRHDGWFVKDDRSEVYHVAADALSYDVYLCSSTERSRRRPTYEHIRRVDGDLTPTHLASVDVFDDHFVTLLSMAPVPRNRTPRMSFLDTLHSWPNQSLWRYFKCDGDGEWIRRAVINGTLRFVHDGSYMKKVAPKICSAAFILSCSSTGMRATGTLVEHSDSADNYRAEALGAAAGLLVLRAATSRQFRYLDVVAHCDNMGIVKHGNAADSPCVEKQVHADLIVLIKKLIRELPCKLTYEHVFGHLDEILRWDQLTYVQKLNVLCDGLAKEALLAAILNRIFIDRGFPFEDIVFSCGRDLPHETIASSGGRSKIVASPTKGLYHWWGYQTARDFFHSKKIVHIEYFDLINWEGMGSAMRTFPVMFRRWVTKHVSGFCGCNEHLSHYTAGLDNVCPACASPRETPAHITVCQDFERSRLFTNSVDALVEWMKSHETSPLLAVLIEDYLRARGTRTMAEVAPPGLDAAHRILVKYHDLLGWQNFVEGRILSYLVQLQREHLAARDTWRTAETWARGLIEQLLRLTHRQWLLRNALLHYKLPDGRTLAQRERLVERIMELMWTDPDELLPEDHALLDEDFEKLGEADANDQAYWVAEMESALQAARHVFERERTSQPTSSSPNPRTDPTTIPTFRPTTQPTSNTEPSIDTEGSIRYRRRRKK